MNGSTTVDGEDRSEARILEIEWNEIGGAWREETRNTPDSEAFFPLFLRSLSALHAILLEALPRGSSIVKAATRPWRKMNFTPFEIVTRRVIHDNGAGCASDRLNWRPISYTWRYQLHIRRSNRRWWTDIGGRQLASTMGDYFRTFVSSPTAFHANLSSISSLSIARRFCTKGKEKKEREEILFENCRSIVGRKMARADDRRFASGESDTAN